MHERSIAEELVDQAVAQARENGISRITRIQVSLGENSHVTGEALSTWFELLREGTVAEPADLEIEVVEGDSVLLMALQGEA